MTENARPDRLASVVDRVNAIGLAVNRRTPTDPAAYRVKCELIRLKGGACLDCGFTVREPADTACFDLHHRDPSAKLFSFNLAARHTWVNVTAELVKCDLLCANCHRKRHFGHGNRDRKAA